MQPIALARLTREGRDTLWLLMSLAWCLAPHAGRLPIWCSLGTLVALVWRARLAWRDAPLPPRWLLFACLAASVGLTWSTHHTLIGREAGITLITVLAALKTMELRAKRDAFVVTCLGFFLAFTQFLYSQSILMALLMLMGCWGLLASLVLSQRPTGRPSVSSAIKVSGKSIAWGLPLMLALYVFFPRLGPLWSIPSDAGTKTGLSDRLRLGHVSELAQDDSIAMRVRFDSAPPAPQQMYFRGPVLTRFDGQTWSGLATSDTAAAQGQRRQWVDSDGRLVKYEVTLEPTRLRSLPLLDRTLFASPSSPLASIGLRQSGLDWLSSAPLTERIQIQGQAWLGARDFGYNPGRLQDEYLQLPPGLNPRTRAWTKALRSRPDLQNGDARALSTAVMAHIRVGRFSYTLAPDDRAPGMDGRPEQHLIDRFWMDRRSGFCEHFATAYVVVMRNMGIPARVITGFQGAERNMFDGLYVVRNSDAHAWAEFWQDGEGWVRVDPTAAVAPERISNANGLRLTQPGLGRVLDESQSRWLKTLHAYMEAGNHRWNVWVIQYSGDRQMNLLRSWGINAQDWSDLLRICALIFSVASLVGLALFMLSRPRLRKTPWEITMWQLHRSLSALGLPPPNTCPAPAPALAWVQQIKAHRNAEWPQDLRDFLITKLDAIDELRYGSEPSTASSGTRAKSLTQQIRQRVNQHLRITSSKK